MQKLYLLIIISVFTQCGIQEETHQHSKLINFNNKQISYTGRINFNDTEAIIYWQGSTVKLNFKGSNLKILMQDQHGENYYNIILDQDSIRLFHPDSTKKWYTLVSSIENTKHSIEIFKRTEWDHGASYIYAFETGENTKLLDAPPQAKKNIEFFGNSITAGYAIEDTLGDSPDSTLTNNYLTYAAITARHFHAGYYSTSKSGIGITISWFPLIMPEMYYRLNPTDSSSRWDFTKMQPDLVVINLFQNDATLSGKPDYPEFTHRYGKEKPNAEYFIKKYKEFVLKIRKVYPKANIICALGPMGAVKTDAPWSGYIKQALAEINDDKIYTLFFPYIHTNTHPKIHHHKQMADTLIKFIEKNNLL